MHLGAGVGAAVGVSVLRGQGVGLPTVKVSFWPGVRTKNMNYFSVAGCLKSCYANHVFGRREDGTPFMKCCNRFIGIMGAVFTCLGLKSKRAKPSSAWLSYELLFHQIDFLDFFSKATPINRPIAEETRPVRKSKNSGIDITLARRYWLSERVSNP